MIDLDAARAARREARGEAPTLTYGGELFELPVELPFLTAQALLSFVEDAENGTSAVFDDVLAIVRPLLGEQFDRFMASAPSMDDLVTLLSSLPGEYGFKNMGESQASEGSSAATSRPSKPTSAAAMAST